MAKKTFRDRWAALPKEVKVLPYVALSGAIVALVDYLGEFEVNNAFWMAVVNLFIVFLQQSKGRVERLRK